MQPFHLNPVDLGVVILILLSGFLAFMRGFTKEVLSVVGWVGAAFATLYLRVPLEPIVRRYVSPTYIADPLTWIVIFLATLVTLSLLSHAIAARVRGSIMGPLDRSLGLLFGLGRGIVVACIAFLLLAWAMPVASDRPAWLREARVVPLLERGGDMLLGLLPEATRQRSRAAVGRSAGQARDTIDAARTLQRLTTPPGGPTSTPDTDRESGYKGDERRTLDNLIRNNQER